MDRKAASKVVEILLKCSGSIDQSIALAKEGSSEPEFETYRTSAGRVMGSIFLDLLGPIFGEHPDLEPDELRRS